MSSRGVPAICLATGSTTLVPWVLAGSPPLTGTAGGLVTAPDRGLALD